MTPHAAWKILDEAELIVEESLVQEAIKRLASEISICLCEKNPIVLAIMKGGIFFSGQLLPLLRFPLEMDYAHASRYGDSTSGGELRWTVPPPEAVKNRSVLVLDDILDAGNTLRAVHDQVMLQGAASCHIAVLAEKDLGIIKPVRADFVGIKLPDRYVFGCGLDVRGAWRNLPAIYALRGR